MKNNFTSYIMMVLVILMAICITSSFSSPIQNIISTNTAPSLEVQTVMEVGSSTLFSGTGSTYAVAYQGVLVSNLAIPEKDQNSIIFSQKDIDCFQFIIHDPMYQIGSKFNPEQSTLIPTLAYNYQVPNTDQTTEGTTEPETIQDVIQCERRVVGKTTNEAFDQIEIHCALPQITNMIPDTAFPFKLTNVVTVLLPGFDSASCPTTPIIGVNIPDIIPAVVYNDETTSPINSSGFNVPKLPTIYHDYQEYPWYNNIITGLELLNVQGKNNDEADESTTMQFYINLSNFTTPMNPNLTPATEITLTFKFPNTKNGAIKGKDATLTISEYDNTNIDGDIVTTSSPLGALRQTVNLSTQQSAVQTATFTPKIYILNNDKARAYEYTIPLNSVLQPGKIYHAQFGNIFIKSQYSYLNGGSNDVGITLPEYGIEYPYARHMGWVNGRKTPPSDEKEEGLIVLIIVLVIFIVIVVAAAAAAGFYCCCIQKRKANQQEKVEDGKTDSSDHHDDKPTEDHRETEGVTMSDLQTKE